MPTNQANLDEMDKFFKRDKLTKLSNEETENLNRPLTRN